MVRAMAPDADRTDIPAIEPEVSVEAPGDDAAAPDGGGRGRRRRPQLVEPDFSEPPPEPSRSERPAADSVTEQQLIRAFYWLYRGWCKLLGSSVDANQSDFQDLGKAWLELARKVPGIRWLIAFAGPVFTLTDLLDKLAVAWSVRTRFRDRLRVPANWRQRSQSGGEAPAADAQVVDGRAGAP